MVVLLFAMQGLITRVPMGKRIRASLLLKGARFLGLTGEGADACVPLGGLRFDKAWKVSSCNGVNL